MLVTKTSTPPSHTLCLSLWPDTLDSGHSEPYILLLQLFWFVACADMADAIANALTNRNTPTIIASFWSCLQICHFSSSAYHTRYSRQAMPSLILKNCICDILKDWHSFSRTSKAEPFNALVAIAKHPCTSISNLELASISSNESWHCYLPCFLNTGTIPTKQDQVSHCLICWSPTISILS